MVEQTPDLPDTPSPLVRSAHNWIISHDDSKLFVFLYIGLAVVLSIWISLFWLVAVVAVHFAFEVIRQRHLRSGFRAVLAESLWELKLDIALVLFALVVSVYMEVVLGVVGLQSAARVSRAAQVGLRGGTRFAAWQRVIRGVLLSVDDAAQVVRAATSLRAKGRASDGGAAVGLPAAVAVSDSLWGSWAGRWGKGDWIAIGLGVVSLLLIVAAPLLTDHSFSSMFTTLASELQPFPAGD